MKYLASSEESKAFSDKYNLIAEIVTSFAFVETPHT